MTAWYVDWFNSSEYLTVYNHRNQNEADAFAATIVKDIVLPENCETLDLACGAGRHAIAFAKYGHSVTAVDLSPKLLEVARESMLESDLKIDFVRDNILTFRSPKKFDLALNVFTSFGYFDKDDDNFGIFRTAKTALRQNGYFVFDYFNVNYIRTNFVPYTRKFFGKTIVEQSRFIDGEKVGKTILIQSNLGLKAYRESVKLYGAEELCMQLGKVGFTIVSLKGNYGGEPFNEVTSPRFIAICKSV